MASCASWDDSAPSTPEARSQGDSVADTGFIKHKVLKTDNLAGIAIKYRASIADIKRVNSLASDTALFAREHVLVPTKPLAPPGEDGAQVAMARLLSGRAPLPQQQTSGRRRTDGWASASMRSGASSRSGAGGRLSLLLDVGGVGGGGGDDGFGGGAGGGYSDEGGGGTPYSRRSDRSFAFTAAAENPGDVELMDRGGGGGSAAAALADRLTSRRRMVLAGVVGGGSSPLVLVGPSPSAPNLSAWLGGGSASASGQGQQQQQQQQQQTTQQQQHDALPPLPRRSTGPPPPPPAAAAMAPAPPPLLRQLSEAFGQTALATVDALTRAASQPALRKRAD